MNRSEAELNGVNVWWKEESIAGNPDKNMTKCEDWNEFKFVIFLTWGFSVGVQWTFGVRRQDYL